MAMAGSFAATLATVLAFLSGSLAARPEKKYAAEHPVLSARGVWPIGPAKLVAMPGTAEPAPELQPVAVPKIDDEAAIALHRTKPIAIPSIEVVEPDSQPDAVPRLENGEPDEVPDIELVDRGGLAPEVHEDLLVKSVEPVELTAAHATVNKSL